MTPSYRELIAQRHHLNEKIAAARGVERPRALEKAKTLIDDFQFTADELGLVATQRLAAGKKGPKTFPAKTVRPPQPPKYVNPDTGQTWSGRGRQPHWMTGNPDEYLIRDLA